MYSQQTQTHVIAVDILTHVLIPIVGDAVA